MPDREVGAQGSAGRPALLYTVTTGHTPKLPAVAFAARVVPSTVSTKWDLSEEMACRQVDRDPNQSRTQRGDTYNWQVPHAHALALTQAHSRAQGGGGDPTQAYLGCIVPHTIGGLHAIPERVPQGDKEVEGGGRQEQAHRLREQETRRLTTP